MAAAVQVHIPSSTGLCAGTCSDEAGYWDEEDEMLMDLQQEEESGADTPAPSGENSAPFSSTHMRRHCPRVFPDEAPPSRSRTVEWSEPTSPCA